MKSFSMKQNLKSDCSISHFFFKLKLKKRKNFSLIKKNTDTIRKQT